MLLDIGVGLLGALGWHLWSGEPLSWQLALLGVTFSLLPDVDFLVQAARRRSLLRVDHTHREMLHHPIPYLLLGGALVYLIAPDLLFLFVLMSLAHFVHDSTGIGWGIPWLSPFSARHGKLFSTKRGDFSWVHAVWWTKREREAVIRERGNPDWMRDMYGKVSPTSVAEALVLAGALAALLLLL